MLTGIGIGGLIALAGAPPLQPADLESIWRALAQDAAIPAPEAKSTIDDRHGTDPTEIRTRVEFRYDDADLQDHVEARIGTVRIDIGLSDQFVLRGELPYAEVETRGPPHETVSGIGDTLVGLGWRVAHEENFSVLFGANLTFDTAQDDLLGTGHTQLVPEIATAFGLPEIRSVFYPVYRHILSLGDDSGATPFNMSLFDTMLVTHWTRRTWTSCDARYFVDWEAKGQTGMTVEFEAGAMLSRDIGLWARPGLGVFGDDLPGVYDWNLVVGLRFLF